MQRTATTTPVDAPYPFVAMTLRPGSLQPTFAELAGAASENFDRECLSVYAECAERVARIRAHWDADPAAYQAAACDVRSQVCYVEAQLCKEWWIWLRDRFVLFHKRDDLAAGLVWCLDKVQEQMPEFLEVNAQLQQLQLQQASTSPATTTASDTATYNDQASDPDMQEDQ